MKSSEGLGFNIESQKEFEASNSQDEVPNKEFESDIRSTNKIL